MQLTDTEKAQYRQLWSSCKLRAERTADIDALVDRIVANRKRYEAAAKQVGMPWQVVGAIHQLEASGNFKTHLHNGDPLTARTVRVPAGRPPNGKPPFTWEQSAADALELKFADHHDWSVPGTLYALESYNGFGYRKHGINSPYLWSFSTNYTKGKYVKDGVFDANAVSAQCGAAVLLHRMAERGIAALDGGGGGGGGAPQPAVLRYAPGHPTDAGKRLQQFLNTFPGISLEVDGDLGDNSSAAFKKVTGHYLAGDPRAKQ